MQHDSGRPEEGTDLPVLCLGRPVYGKAKKKRPIEGAFLRSTLQCGTIEGLAKGAFP
jgi:hypothetical protein